MLQDVHRIIVVRKDMSLRKARLTSHRAWFTSMIAAVHKPFARGWKCSTTVVRADATNASCWQRCKLHSTQIDGTSVRRPVTEDDTVETMGAAAERRICICPLQVVESTKGASTGTAGRLTHALLDKQVSSVSCGVIRVGGAPHEAIGPSEEDMAVLGDQEGGRGHR